MRDIIENKEINVNEINIIPLATIKQENQCVLTLDLFKDSIPFEVENQTIKLSALLPSGIKQEQTENINVNKNNINIILNNSIVSESGKVELELTFTDDFGFMTSSSFYLNVVKKILDKKTVESTTYLESVEILIKNIKKDYESLRRVIIDENQAVNLQEQINSNQEKTFSNTNNINSISKTLIKNVVDYGAVGNGIADDSIAFINALNNNKYIECQPDKVYVLKNELVLNNKTIDFNNATLKYEDVNAGIRIKAGGKLKNVRILVSGDIKLNNPVIVVDGEDEIRLGLDDVLIENVIATQQGGSENVGFKNNDLLYFDCEQKILTKRYTISGVNVINLKGNWFNKLISFKAKELEGNQSKVYITSCNFKNIQGYNNSYDIYENEIINQVGSNRVSIECNSFDCVEFQPADDQPHVYLVLHGNRHFMTNVAFWDNTRPSNKDNTQIQILGKYNNISGGAMPSYDTPYITNNPNNYNVITGVTYGIPSTEMSTLVVDRRLGLKDKFDINGGYKPLVLTDRITFEETKFTSSSESIYSKTIDITKLPKNAYTCLDVNLFGKISGTGSSRIDVYINNSWFTGVATKLEITGDNIGWSGDFKIIFNKREATLDVTVCHKVDYNTSKNRLECRTNKYQLSDVNNITFEIRGMVTGMTQSLNYTDVNVKTDYI